MNKIFILVLGILVFASECSAQNSTRIEGNVFDSLEKKSLQYALISVVRKKDSMLIAFARTDEIGKFSISNIEPGQYDVVVTYPTYTDHIIELEISNQTLVNVERINLIKKIKLLQEVIVKSTTAAIRIKGDTTVFLADSFFVKEGATVEDLLKKFPNFQVDSRGNVFAYGKRVDKILVDGEEFFGNDPTMTTQNISARQVDKVQLYDTKTEQQRLTGIGSINSGKTIDIKLKEEAKKGGIGRVHFASDYHKFHDAKGLYNYFVGKKKASLYLIKSNISSGNLNSDERGQLDIEEDDQFDAVRNYYNNFGGTDFIQDANRGLPNMISGGGLYSNKWKDDINNVNFFYNYNDLTNVNSANTFSEIILPDKNNFFNMQKSNFTSSYRQNSIRGKYERRLDSSSTIKIISTGLHRYGKNNGQTGSKSVNASGQYINTSTINRENNAERWYSDNQINFRKMLKKKDRLLLLHFRLNSISDNNNELFETQNQFYKNNFIDSIDLVNQMKDFKGLSQTIGAKITFNEPFSSKWNLVLDYSFNKNSINSDYLSYSKSSNGNYNLIDSLFSNLFALKATSNYGAAIIRFTSKKTRISFGSGISNVKLDLTNKWNKSNDKYTFFNVVPQLEFNYNFKSQATFGINYSGLTLPPNLNQLQPLNNNNDPLNIYIGNPNLKMAFKNNIGLRYFSYKTVKSRLLYFSLTFNSIQRGIVNYSMVDSTSGKRTNMPVNSNGNRAWTFYSGWDKGGNGQLKKSISLQSTFGTTVNFINAINENFLNASKLTNDYYSFSLSFGLGKNINEKYSFEIKPRLGYNVARYSKGYLSQLSYFTYGLLVNGFTLLPGKVEFNTNFLIDYRQRITAFDNNFGIYQWNAELSKRFLKKKSAKIAFIANDIFNSVKGYNRIINSSVIIDENYLRVSRYFLLKLELNLSNTFTNKQ